MKNLYLLSFVILLAVSCNPPEKNSSESSDSLNVQAEVSEPSLKEALLGEWRNYSLNITIAKETGDSIVTISQSDWENILQIKPVRTTFSNDSSFSSEYRNLSDSVIMINSGVWFIKNDSLVYMTRGKSFVYDVEISGDTATFTGYTDWDEDGEVDDLYDGKQIKY